LSIVTLYIVSSSLLFSSQLYSNLLSSASLCFILLFSAGISSLTDLPHDPYFTFLEAFAAARQKGLTVDEASKILKTTSNTLNASFEKLLLANLLVKSNISPIRGAKNPRNANRRNIYHLKRFYPFYCPEEDEMMMGMDESTAFRMENVVMEVLQQHGLTKMTLSKLFHKIGTYDSLKVMKKELSQRIFLLKEKNRMVIFTDMTLTTHKLISVTKPIARVCIGLRSVHPLECDSTALTTAAIIEGDGSGDSNNSSLTPRIRTVRNLAMYEQLVDRLNVAPRGLPTTE
jgi:hypothetical protein